MLLYKYECSDWFGVNFLNVFFWYLNNIDVYCVVIFVLVTIFLII